MDWQQTHYGTCREVLTFLSTDLGCDPCLGDSRVRSRDVKKTNDASAIASTVEQRETSAVNCRQEDCLLYLGPSTSGSSGEVNAG